MKKKNKKQRKLRKCELGKKTKQLNKGCRYYLGLDNIFRPFR